MQKREKHNFQCPSHQPLYQYYGRFDGLILTDHDAPSHSLPGLTNVVHHMPLLKPSSTFETSQAYCAERKSEVARSSGLGSFSLRFAAIWKYRTSFLNWKFCTDKRRYLNSLLNNTQDPSWISDLPNVDLAVREGQSEFLEECAWKWPTIVLRLWTASRWVDFDWSLPRYLCSLPLSLAILTASSQMSYGVRKYRLGIGIPKISGPTRLNPDSACISLIGRGWRKVHWVRRCRFHLRNNIEVYRRV